MTTSPGLLYTAKDDYDKDDETVAIPNSDDFGCSDDSNSDTDCNETFSSITYEKASKSYLVDQAVRKRQFRQTTSMSALGQLGRDASLTRIARLFEL